MSIHDENKTLSAQIYRQVITHHRNQIKFLCGMIRDGSGHKPTCLKLAKSHAAEIKLALDDWEASYPIARKS